MKEIKCLILWHYFNKGKLVNASTTLFEGTIQQLQNSVGEDYQKNKESPQRCVCQQIIML